jgi:NAD-dependent deacetylase
LVDLARPGIPMFIVDKKIPDTSAFGNLVTIEQPASTGVHELMQRLAALR